MTRFPKGLARLIPDDLTGEVVGLVVRPKRRAPVVPVDAWDISGSADHGRSGKRAVTLISEEHVEAIRALADAPDLRWEDLRRNVLIRGLSVNAMRGRRIAVGDVVLEGTKPCDPCSRMPEIVGPAGYAAMLGIGGMCAAIVTPGVIRVGDPVRLLPLDDGSDPSDT